MGDIMKTKKTTREPVVHELTELRSQNAEQKKTITGSLSAEITAEEALHYAESIVETVREPLLVLDADLKILSANRNFYRTFKVIPAETLGCFIYDLGNKQWDIPKLRKLLEEVLLTKQGFEGFEVTKNFYGTGQKSVLLNGAQIYGETIGPKIILVAIEDITECLNLGETCTKLNAIVESSDDAIISKDLDGIIDSWNHGAEVIYGYTAKEVIGKSISLIMAPDSADEYKDIIARILREEPIRHYETKRKRKDGQLIDVSVTISPIRDRSGKILGASAIARDITERKRMENLLLESEERYRRIFETSRDGILLLEKREGKISHANPATAEILGYTRDEIIGKKLQDLDIMLNITDFQEILQQLNSTGVMTFNDIPVKAKTGRQIYTDIYLVDRASLVQCNIRDITNRKLAEEALSSAVEELRETNAALRVLLRQRDEDRRVMEEKIHSNIKQLVLPYVDLLKKSRQGIPEDKAYINILESNLQNITSSFTIILSRELSKLTPQEIIIANLVKEGQRDKKIAAVLNLSISTVKAHRRNIRKKLALSGKKTNLRSYLTDIFAYNHKNSR